jgi:hypothetical protein
MPGITVAQAQEHLDAYLAAEIKVLAGQSYEIAGRKLTRADLAEIRAGIDTWNERLANLSSRASGRGRAYTVVAR